MPKKDYIKLAGKIKILYRCQPTQETLNFIEEICSVLKQDNKNFNENTFKHACGVYENDYSNADYPAYTWD